jgi:hypothetical protein
MKELERDRERFATLLDLMKPRVDLTAAMKEKLQGIVENCVVAFQFVGPYLECLTTLPEDMQITMTDVLRQSVELRLKCARLLALKRLDNLPVTEIDAQWEALCTSLSFIGTTLAPALSERMDAVL